MRLGGLWGALGEVSSSPHPPQSTTLHQDSHADVPTSLHDRAWETASEATSQLLQRVLQQMELLPSQVLQYRISTLWFVGKVSMS